MRIDLLQQLAELLQSQQEYIHELERTNRALIFLLAQYMTQEEIEKATSKVD